jgi:cell division septation protein DedD
MAHSTFRSFGLASVTFLLLGACQGGQGPFAGSGKSDATAADETIDATVNANTSTRLVDRDVEAPEVFQVEDTALWDGRPSLGGVWVASPEAKDPERVIMRNPANGKFVIGALFRRERENPGPELQISSDAAAALGFLAGQPGKINVTALRREEEPATTDASQPILDAAETVETAPIDPIAGAEAAIDRAEGVAEAAPTEVATAAPTGKRVPKMDPSAITTQGVAPANSSVATVKSDLTPTPAPSDAPAAAKGDIRIQIGIFSVEANAQRAVDALAKAGITGTVRKEESQGKAFWSVVARGDTSTLAKVKSAGFADAYVLKG